MDASPQTDRMSVEMYRSLLRQNLPLLKERFGVETLAIFGSYVHGQQHAQSDLDLLVTFHDTPSLFTLVELQDLLSDLLHIRIDLVMPTTMRPSIAQQVLAEAVLI